MWVLVVSCHNPTFEKPVPDNAQVYCRECLFCYLPRNLEVDHSRREMSQDS